MQNKGYFIGKILPLLFIVGILINALINAPSNRIIYLPFLICTFAELLKTVFLMMGKDKLAKLSKKIYIITFLLCWFGFLFYWCYLNIINGDYPSLAFSAPFWLAGVFAIYKAFFKKTSTPKENKRASKFNPKIIVGVFLVGICLLSGILMLFFGIKDTYTQNKIAKNYSTTTGYFDYYDVYRVDEDGTTYRLAYTYTVEDVDYTIQTDYGSSYIPEPGSTREVKYNPKHPAQSVLVGTNKNNGLIYMGAFFTLGGFTFVLAALYMTGCFDKVNFNIMGIYMGSLCLIIGIGIILFQNGTTGSFIETVKSFGLWILIPFMFIIAGIQQLIKWIFLDKKRT